jgi:hypothetical protein
MHYLMVRITPFPSLKGRDGDELGSYVLIESIISPNRFNESHK